MPKSRNTTELEANIFAVMLLIPEKFLLPELQKGLELGGSRSKIKEPEYITELCKKFQVTHAAMTFRLMLLNKKYPKGIPQK